MTREELLIVIREIRNDYLYSIYNKKQARAVSLQKQWVKNCTQLVAISKTVLQFKEAYFESPDESKPKTDAYFGWLICCAELIANAKTSDQVINVLRDSPPAIELQERALAKRIELCSTSAIAKQEFINSTPGSYESDEFLFKWIELCSSIEEIEEALGKTRHGSTARKAALAKLEELKVQI